MHEADGMRMEDRIRQKLETGLRPSYLHIENQSQLHAGHAGDDGSGESHFYVEIVAEAFTGQSIVARHRIVHEILGNTLTNCIHAISIKANAPKCND